MPKPILNPNLEGFYESPDYRYYVLHGVGLVAAYSFIVTLIIGFIIEKTIGFRVKRDAEVEGIDLNEHAESAYEMYSSSRGGSSL